MDEIVGVGLPDALPADWLARAEQETGGRFAARLLEDSAQMIPADHREKADAEANRVVDQARSLVREERLFAIEHGAEVVSFDRDFQRFIGLRSRLLT